MFLECCRASVLRLSSARKASKISDANVVGLVFLECCRTSVLRLSGARNASKISDVIFVSDASNASLAKVETLFPLVSFVTLTLVSPVKSLQ